ncbi:hypothetical protein D3C72_942910 [compost metagenome]
MAVVQLLPKGLLLVFTIGRHVALQIVGPCQNGFGHHAGKLRVLQPDDGGSLVAQLQHQPLDARPQAVNPCEARKRGDIGGIGIGDDGKVHCPSLFVRQFGEGEDVLLRHGGA